MPSWWWRWLILLFWLATTGWLFWNDVRPRWRRGEPPSFRLDDVEEVGQQHSITRAHTSSWTVLRQNAKTNETDTLFHATTWIDYDNEEDAFTINAKLDASKDQSLKRVVVGSLQVDVITSTYRVNRSGQLLALEATVEGQTQPVGPFLFGILKPPTPFPEPVSLRVWGEVRDRRYFGHCKVGVKSLGKPIQFDLPPVAVSHTGSVLMPLHPVHHVRGLHLGQNWRQPLMDPLGFSGSVRWLYAHVLPHREVLDLNGNKTICMVIEYSNEENEPMGRTWVEQESELVMQQEAIRDDGRWIMRRDLQRRNRNSHPGPLK